MKKNNIYGLISIGIIVGAIFPQALQNLIFKIFERILFNSKIDTFIASGIAAIIGLIISIFIFEKFMNYLVNFDYSKNSELKKALVIGILIKLSFITIWFIIPFIDGWLGESYIQNLRKGYEILNSNIYISKILINGIIPLICYFFIVIIIFKKVNTVANTV